MVVDVATARPGRALDPHVERYVGYRLSGFAPGVHRGMPSRRLTLIISLGAPVEILAGPDGGGAARMQAFVGGLHTRAALVGHDGEQHGISVDLTPLGARAVLGLPGGALAGTVADLGDVLGARGRDLAERLAGAPGWPARFALLDDALSRGLHPADGPGDGVARAWHLIVARPDLEVRALAREVGWSRRHLSERVRQEVGLPPRQLARVIRFERSVEALGRPELATLGEVAVRAGYHDHAHMLHEWHALAGCTPREWIREEELPSVQDALGAGGAD